MPNKFVRLCSQFHAGQDCMLYAVASSNGLKRGTMRPYNDDASRPMTDLEWKYHLYSCLKADVRFAMRHNTSSKYVQRFQRFIDWIDRQMDRMESKLENVM